MECMSPMLTYHKYNSFIIIFHLTMYPDIIPLLHVGGFHDTSRLL